MAHSRQAKKRVRQTKRRTLVRRARLSRVRTFISKVEAAIEAGDQEAARETLRTAQPKVMQGMSKGALKRNTAVRKISRLARQVKAMPS